MTRPAILVTRAVFPEVLARLQTHFEVEDNQVDNLLSTDQLCEKIANKQGVLSTPSEAINAQVIMAAQQLKAISNIAVGYNNFDLPALTTRGIIATNTPDVLTETTADMAWALLMATARRVTESEAWLRAGNWKQWALTAGFLGAEVYGTTLGIIGMGRIGQAIAKRAQGFGMRVVYHNRSQLSAEQEQACGAQYVSKADLLAQADHVVLVLPYSAQTHHTIGAAELAQMKRSATLINIARGGIVDDAALAKALRERQIFAAGLDVFEGEPAVHPDLLDIKNIVLTPHIGSATRATRLAMANLAADNLIAALGFGPHAGHPPSCLNPELLSTKAP